MFSSPCSISRPLPYFFRTLLATRMRDKSDASRDLPAGCLGMIFPCKRLYLSWKNGGKGGFEPSVPLTRYTGLAVQHLKPLSHLSAWLTTRGWNIIEPQTLCKRFYRYRVLPILIGIKKDDIPSQDKVGYPMGNDRSPDILGLNVEPSKGYPTENRCAPFHM